MLLLLGGKLGKSLHVCVVEADRVGAVIQAEKHAQVLRVSDTLDAVVVQQIVLLLALLQLDLELGVLLFLLQAHQLAQHVAEEGVVADSPLPPSHFLPHLPQPDREVRAPVERAPQYFQHGNDEVLCPRLPTGQLF